MAAQFYQARERESSVLFCFIVRIKFPSQLVLTVRYLLITTSDSSQIVHFPDGKIKT